MGWNRFKDSVIGSQNYAWPESEIESQNNLSRVRVSKWNVTNTYDETVMQIQNYVWRVSNGKSQLRMTSRKWINTITYKLSKSARESHNYIWLVRVRNKKT